MTLTRRLGVLARFSRPHTVIATTIQAIGLFVVAGGHRLPPGTSVALLATTLTACLALNVYIVGLNQLTDVSIDRINKPYLPLAGGLLSRHTAKWWVLVAGILALTLGAAGSPYLLGTIASIGLIGSAYSLPPVRLKNHAVLAALCIALARGVIANVGLLMHYSLLTRTGSLASAGPATTALALSPNVTLTIALFFFAFGLVIAVYKDIPDIAGDVRYGVGTFAVRWGPRRAFSVGRFLLTVAYLGLLVYMVGRSGVARMDPLVGIQAGLPAAFWVMSRRTDPTNPAAMARFYRVLWVLFYLEYVVLAIFFGTAPRV